MSTSLLSTDPLSTNLLTACAPGEGARKARNIKGNDAPSPAAHAGWRLSSSRACGRVRAGRAWEGARRPTRRSTPYPGACRSPRPPSAVGGARPARRGRRWSTNAVIHMSRIRFISNRAASSASPSWGRTWAESAATDPRSSRRWAIAASGDTGSPESGFHPSPRLPSAPSATRPVRE